MRQRGFSQITTVVVAALLALLLAPLFMGWLVVDVKTKGRDAHHFWLPLPVGVARIAMVFVPEKELACNAPAELVRHRELLRVLLDNLATCGDTTLVEVRSREANVRIATDHGKVRLDVDARDARVHAAFRVEAVRAALARWDGDEIRGHQALDLLASLGRGQLLSVESEDADVSISYW
jgi:hypothetical protein